MSLKRSKGLLILAVVCLLAMVMVTGCGQEAVDEPASGDEGLSGSIIVAGSTSVQPVSELLAEAFMAKHKQVNVVVQGGGSSAGIRSAVDGVADIGSSSRNLKEKEKGQGLEVFVIAKDGIAVIVHPSNEVAELTLEQIKGIFAGEITNWKDVGGADEKIMAVTREEGSGTRGAFEDIVMDDTLISDGAIVQPSTGAVSTTVAGDPKAIGYISLAALSAEVKAVQVEGVDATAENILADTYKIARPFIYVTMGEPTGLAKEFIDFVLSSEGQAVVEGKKLIRVD